jgi:hypothetical protein
VRLGRGGGVSLGRVGRRCGGAAEESGAGDDRGEGGDLERSLYAGGQYFLEENEACRDRDGVRDERREAGGGQSAAVLERRLEHARAGRVADNQRDQREQPDAAEGDELRGNVSVGE